MNADLVKTLKIIFENLIDRKQCEMCDAHWFKFNHDGDVAYYRLGQLAPSACSTCRPIDEELEKDTVFTAERWFEL